jgi:antibiotic biosynthesis monooxygenase (ABM) superfamily enzyme
MEFWFIPPTVTHKRAPQHKQFLLVLSVTYPLTLVALSALNPLINRVPAVQLLLVHRFVNVGVAVLLMTYGVMPRYTRLVSGWLYR